MKTLSWLPLALILLAAPARADEAREFSVVPVVVEVSAPLSAWQVHLRFTDPTARIVGVEGGDTESFAEPPHYDPKALDGGEIILAALGSHPDAPEGRLVVARLHVEHARGETPALGVVELIAVGDDGQQIPAEVVQQNGEDR